MEWEWEQDKVSKLSLSHKVRSRRRRRLPHALRFVEALANPSTHGEAVVSGGGEHDEEDGSRSGRCLTARSTARQSAAGKEVGVGEEGRPREIDEGRTLP